MPPRWEVKCGGPLLLRAMASIECFGSGGPHQNAAKTSRLLLSAAVEAQVGCFEGFEA